MNNNIVKLIAVIALLALLIVSVVACVSSGNTENTDPATDAITTADEDDGATETKKPFKPIITTDPPIETEPPVEIDTSNVGIVTDADTQFGGAVDMH